MKRLLFGMLAAATFAGCSAAALLSDLNRMLVSGTVLLDGIAEPATVHLFRQSTGEIADSEDPARFALGLWTLVNGYAESHRTGRGIFAGMPGARLSPSLLDQTLRPLVELMLRGASPS